MAQNVIGTATGRITNLEPEMQELRSYDPAKNLAQTVNGHKAMVRESLDNLSQQLHSLTRELGSAQQLGVDITQISGGVENVEVAFGMLCAKLLEAGSIDQTTFDTLMEQQMHREG